MPAVEITVKRKRRHSNNSEVRRGPLDRRREPEYLPRRKGEVLLNFYDLGQKWDGAAWRDINFSIVPAPVFGASEIPDFSSGNWASLQTAITATDFDDWETAFRPLTYEMAELYGLDLYIGPNAETFDAAKYLPIARSGSRRWVKDPTVSAVNAKWTEDGLKIPRGTGQFQIWSHGAFVSRKNVDSPYKVTAGAASTYASDAVDFKFTRDSKIFLFPMPVNEWAESTSNLSQLRRTALNLMYTTMPREFFLERTLTFVTVDGATIENLDGNMFQYPGKVTNNMSGHGSGRAHNFASSDAIEADFLSFLKARSWIRAYDVTNNTTYSVANFPIYHTGNGVLWTGGYGSGEEIDFGFGFSGFIPVPAGSPVAAIKRGTEWFWVWYNGSTFVPVLNHTFCFNGT